MLSRKYPDYRQTPTSFVSYENSIIVPRCGCSQAVNHGDERFPHPLEAIPATS